MAGKKQTKIIFNSWLNTDREEQAREIISGMLTMGSPIVYQGGGISRIKYDALGLATQPMNKDQLLAEIHKTTAYMVKKNEKAYSPDNQIVYTNDGVPIVRVVSRADDIPRPLINCIFGLGWPDNGLWVLKGVMSHPIVNAQGQIVMRNGLYWREHDVNGIMKKAPRIVLPDGYDPSSEYFFAIPERVQKELEGIENQRVTDADVLAALEVLDEFFTDFSFETKSAYASAVAFMLTLICRELIDGSVPMLEVCAAQSQSGKSLLVKMEIIAVTGERPTPMSPDFRDQAEFGKELLSQLLEGKNYIFFDDVTTKVESSFLNMCLTSGKSGVKKRLLSKNESATVYAGMPFVMTANNPSMSPDIRNRVYLLNLNKPEEGKQFVHTNPESYAMEAGPRVVRALLTLYNNWVRSGRGLFTDKRIDGFIEWSQIIGGILQAAGITGFLDDTVKQIQAFDPKLEQAGDMAEAWYAAYGDVNKQVKDIIPLMVKAGYVKEDASVQSKIQNASSKLASLRKVKLPGGYHFEREEDDKRRSVWRVVKKNDS